MVDGLTTAGVRVYPSEGTYFIQVDARSFGYGDGIALCRALAGRAGVPSAAFFDSAEIGIPLVRLAFCKRAEVIAEAVAGLARLAYATENATTERTFA